MQSRSSDENIILSVSLSVCQMRDLWQNVRKLCPQSYTTWKTIYPSFVRRRMVGGCDTSTWNFGSTGPRWSEIADFQPIFGRSTSAVTPNEKSSINTNRKSTTRFPMSLRWSSYVAPKPQRGVQKRKTAIFGVKSHFAWRKSATKFLYVKTLLIGLTAYKNDWWRQPLLTEILGQSDRIRAKSPIFNLISLVAPQS